MPRRLSRLRYDALEAELAGVAADQFAVAGFMAVELQAGNIGRRASSSAFVLRTLWASILRTC
jgi:hypothetical protein